MYIIFLRGVCVYVCVAMYVFTLWTNTCLVVCVKEVDVASQIGPQQCVWRKLAHLLLQTESCNPALLSPQSQIGSDISATQVAWSRPPSTPAYREK